MQKNDPRHGTPEQPGAEMVPGCHCHPCETARTHRRRTAKMRLRGHYRLTDATPLTAHITDLLAAGWRAADICHATGMGPAAVSDIQHGRRKKVYQATAVKLWKLNPGGQPPGRTVPNVGTIRRIQALSAMGWNMRDVCRRAGLRDHYAADVMNDGADRCSRDAAVAIARVYSELHMRPGPSGPARTRARNRGWYPPMAWDDIDDPGERPKGIVGARGGNGVDEAAVLRRMQGDRSVRLSYAERCELVARWKKTGRSLSEMSRITGVNKPERYAA